MLHADLSHTGLPMIRCNQTGEARCNLTRDDHAEGPLFRTTHSVWKLLLSPSVLLRITFLGRGPQAGQLAAILSPRFPLVACRWICVHRTALGCGPEKGGKPKSLHMAGKPQGKTRSPSQLYRPTQPVSPGLVRPFSTDSLFQHGNHFFARAASTGGIRSCNEREDPQSRAMLVSSGPQPLARGRPQKDLRPISDYFRPELYVQG